MYLYRSYTFFFVIKNLKTRMLHYTISMHWKNNSKRNSVNLFTIILRHLSVCGINLNNRYLCKENCLQIKKNLNTTKKRLKQF